MPGEFLSVPEVAARLQVSRSTLARWRRVGGGPPFVPFCRTVRYPAAGLGQAAGSGRQNEVFPRKRANRG